jgi:tyrosyl-tRNA synthetase
MNLAVESAIVPELRSRGLVHQVTREPELEAHLAAPRSVYAGFDPTRDSLTIGNLVSLLLLRRFQLAGHTPYVVMGGGTGLIGDPSGKDAERSLLTRDEVEANVSGQRRIYERVLDFDGPSGARLLNNADWLGQMGYLEVLRDVGKHFSVNMMIQKDSVKARLEGRDQGISYTEFSYMILQAYDFAYLAKNKGITLEVGGSDQWGNIVAGIELARKTSQLELFGLTTPLVTKSDGGKFGKSESGAVWLTADRTSPYEFYQFWLNAADADAEPFLKIFSLKPLLELEATLAEQRNNPAGRAAQRALACELTELLHGPSGLSEAEQTTRALFSGDVRELSERSIVEAFRGAPAFSLSKSELEGPGISIVDLLVRAEAASSKREARTFLESGAVLSNGHKCTVDTSVSLESLLYGKFILIRRGKKNWYVGQLGETS